MSHENPLPTRDEIRDMTDIEEVQRLKDDVSDAMIRMETNLDYSPGNDDWRSRVAAALVLYRIAFRHLDKRAKELKGSPPPTEPPKRRVRKPEENSVTTNLALEDAIPWDLSEATSVEACDEASRSLTFMIESVTFDLEREREFLPQVRDKLFIQDAEATLRELRLRRQRLQDHTAAIRRKARDEDQRRLERVFVEVVKEAVDPASFASFMDIAKARASGT